MTPSAPQQALADGQALQRAVLGGLAAVHEPACDTRGLDPKAVSAPEVGFAELGAAAYAEALAGYASGEATGVARWLVHCCQATEHGALEGLAICESLLRG